MYTSTHIARAYQSFRRLTQPYYTLMDGTGSISMRLEKFFCKAADTLNQNQIDVVEYFQFLYERNKFPLPNQIYNKALIQQYLERRELNTLLKT